MLCAMFI